jgi:LytS/YehU family sensor histidine kinase
MLLQPFVENSIKYGLQQSQQPMHIQIYFHIDEAYLKICIIDNGNSESNADNINNKSFGNALISKRLNLFYKNAKHQPKLSSTALNDNKGFAVNIYLPV